MVAPAGTAGEHGLSSTEGQTSVIRCSTTTRRRRHASMTGAPKLPSAVWSSRPRYPRRVDRDEAARPVPTYVVPSSATRMSPHSRTRWPRSSWRPVVADRARDGQDAACVAVVETERSASYELATTVQRRSPRAPAIVAATTDQAAVGTSKRVERPGRRCLVTMTAFDPARGRERRRCRSSRPQSRGPRRRSSRARDVGPLADRQVPCRR